MSLPCKLQGFWQNQNGLCQWDALYPGNDGFKLGDVYYTKAQLRSIMAAGAGVSAPRAVCWLCLPSCWLVTDNHAPLCTAWQATAPAVCRRTLSSLPAVLQGSAINKLAFQLIPSKLGSRNYELGGCSVPDYIKADIVKADQIINDRVAPPVGDGK